MIGWVLHAVGCMCGHLCWGHLKAAILAVGGSAPLRLLLLLQLGRLLYGSG